MPDRRDVNDYRRQELAGPPYRVVAFACECGNPDCGQAVRLTLADYDDARTTGRAIVAPRSHPPLRLKQPAAAR